MQLRLQDDVPSLLRHCQRAVFGSWAEPEVQGRTVLALFRRRRDSDGFTEGHQEVIRPGQVMAGDLIIALTTMPPVRLGLVGSGFVSDRLYRGWNTIDTIDGHRRYGHQEAFGFRTVKHGKRDIVVGLVAPDLERQHPDAGFEREADDYNCSSVSRSRIHSAASFKKRISAIVEGQPELEGFVVELKCDWSSRQPARWGVGYKSAALRLADICAACRRFYLGEGCWPSEGACFIMTMRKRFSMQLPSNATRDVFRWAGYQSPFDSKLRTLFMPSVLILVERGLDSELLPEEQGCADKVLQVDKLPLDRPQALPQALAQVFTGTLDFAATLLRRKYTRAC